MSVVRRDDRIPILYLAPWVDYGGTDKGTIDWFRWLDRDRYAPSLITTQPSENRRLAEILPFAEEVWPLPDLMSGSDMPRFIFDFLHTREVAVLHVMNSRLGYELLPDLACLPRPPKVVVQLHVEEADRTGYVRYVTTRYGNLVDAFSVTSEHLAQAVSGYGVSAGKIDLIYTGVDAEDEFAPERSAPVEGLAPHRVHVLYPGRLVEQKDPLLMVEVATALRDRGLAFQIHAVGEGRLEPELTRAIEERGLREHVLIHPPTNRLQSWYSGCDVLLMTSVYEGVPYVVYEAMAMGLPVVAPALPGNTELLGDVAGGLAEPRDDVVGYAGPLAALIENAQRRAEIAKRGRERVRERFSLQRMAQQHGELYDRLTASRADEPADWSSGGPETPIRFRNRRLHETPLVSVVVPCFNHGRFLGECLDGIRAQSYPAVETIVVDDASTDPETLALIEELSGREHLAIIRMTENGGPSTARNAALDHCSGRYVLPVDADNILLPHAIERLVEQIKVAGEEVGFIYPNLEYFGNREDYFEAPDWDLYALMQRNVCDVCSLFDREVFDAERFDETIRVGHEDWEFVLRLAARGIRGEPANGRTVRYRKIGFNRSDSVEHAADAFHEVMRRASPLYQREVEVKSRWSPAVTIAALGPVDAAGEAGWRLARRLVDQSCRDFELIARFEGEWPDPRPEPAVRRLSPALASSNGEALADALHVARGRLLAITAGTGSALLSDAAFVEKVLRLLQPGGGPGGVDVLVLANGSREGPYPMQLLDSRVHMGRPHSIVLQREAMERLLEPLLVDAKDPVSSLVHACVAAGLRIQWRHIDSFGPFEQGDGGRPSVRLPRPDDCEVRGGEEGELWRRWPPLLPAMPGHVARWAHSATWTPPQSAALCRHVAQGGQQRMVTTSREPPSGFALEYDLGCVRLFSLEGTARLLALEDGDYSAWPRGSWNEAPPGSRHLGYVELVAFPLFEALMLALHRPTGQRVLVSGSWDPLLPEVETLGTLGFLEAFPVNPRFGPQGDNPFGLVGLTKAVDLEGRRHRYAAGGRANGVFAAELGALIEVAQPPAIPLWVVDGSVFTDRHRPPAARPNATSVGRWALAPLGWQDFSEPLTKARAIVRRSVESGVALGRPPKRWPEPEGRPSGWLLSEGFDGARPLYAAYHPVTGDQLLTTTPTEATDLGYGQPGLLGYLRAVAPVTGSLEPRGAAIPWASRFGLQPRRA